MMSSAAVPTGGKSAACPPDRIWASVATGLMVDHEAAPWVAHASECDACGALLLEATEDLALDGTPEELAQSRQLATPEWRGKMARAMSAAASSGSITTPRDEG